MRVTEPYTIFKRTLASGRVLYYYQFRYSDGRRSAMKSTGCDTLPAARRYCQKLYNAGEFDRSPAPFFSDYAENFFSPDSKYYRLKVALNDKPLKPKTVEAYTQAVDNQLMPFFGRLLVDEITPAVIKDWIIWASGKWSKKTVNNARGCLNIILESAIDEGYIRQNPMRRIGGMKIEKKSRDLLTVDELRRIWHEKWALESERTIFLLSCITGMRVGEICALQASDVHETFLDVTKTYTDKYGLMPSTKTGMSRKVPFSKSWLPDCEEGFVFLGADGKIDKMGIDRKGRGITVHSLRNFFISYLRSRNVPDAKIRAVTGHADTSMTDVYTVWTPGMFPEVYEAQKELHSMITSDL